MNVVFVEPNFPRNQREFPRALKAVGATVLAVGETPWEWLDEELQSWIDHYYQVGSVTDVDQLSAAVTHFQGFAWIDALEATIESHTLPAAVVRERHGIPGTSVHTTYLCRDKPAMKEALRKAGVPTAASIGASNAEEIRAFVAEQGYPIIIKPRDGAGAAGTHKVSNDNELDAVLDTLGHTGSVAVEEFIEGHEGFYDTISVDGEIKLDFASHYYPGVLEAMRTRWISPQYISTNRIGEGELYGQLRELGERVNEALGIRTSATHMEYFVSPKGLRFSEIGARPPGVGCWDLYAAGNDIDIFRAWADAIVHHQVWHVPSRQFASGIIALRPDRDGTITHIDGVEEVHRKYGPLFIDEHLPYGQGTQPIEAGYMANAWMRLRHRDFDTLRDILDDIGRTVQVRAS
ncbi:acetyl-CoA carboxylase biotin carboxylase subunit family protein [Yimella sp. cx-51]|uniref:ATP-grasp domain-containing protein n=1 Tax=Yimella sp. cx-51 TaxID=2770551 RepID=UPI00165E1E2C|nr:ATP-grasp domain-containing protein [Yimella sp. cx-51]MBC9958033.1 ATP-grasp domain-containing protein [Yimella sp. cx-51]QTH38153.1 ATP-grasp domain-containing protein [Yimella sp. cx-51]